MTETVDSTRLREHIEVGRNAWEAIRSLTADETFDVVTELLAHRELLALRQSDTRIEGGGLESAREAGLEEAAALLDAECKEMTRLAAAHRSDGTFASMDRCNAVARSASRMAAAIRLLGRAAPPAPTPEHVEGDVLSVGEVEVVGYGVRKIGEAVFQPFLNKPDAGPEYEVEPLVLLASATTRIQRAERERVYECAGCGRLTNNPTRDLEDIQSRGGKSCCPERNVKLLTPAEIISRIGQLADAVKVLNGMFAIVGDSRGVDGYHRNGDVAEWDEFPEIEDARTFLSTIGEKPDAE